MLTTSSAARPTSRDVLIRPKRDGGYLAIWPERNIYLPIDALSAVLLRLADGTHALETLVRVGTTILNAEDDPGAKALVITRLERMAEAHLLQMRGHHLPILQEHGPRLNRVYVNLTNRCNLTCPYCYTRSSPHEPIDTDLTLEELDHIAAALEAQGGPMMVILTGGEPLLRPDLPQIIRVFKGRGFIVEMFTNLLKLRPDMEDWLWPLDGISCTYHDILPQVAAREQLFVDNLQRLRSVGLSPTVQKTLTAGSIDSSLAFMRRMLTAGYPVTPNWFDPVGRGADNPELELSEGEARHALHGVQALRRDFKDLVGPLFDFNFSGHNCAEACGAGTTTVMIRNDGDVYPCSNMLDPRLKMGNVRHDSLAEVLGSPVVKQVVLPVSMIEECKDCSYRHTCYGGCRGNTLQLTGRVDRPDPKCSIYKIALAEQLELESVST